MILFLFMLAGGLVGLWIRYYCINFAQRISLEIHQAYCEIYPENPPHFCPEKSVLTPIKCGHFLRYFLTFAFFFGLCRYGFERMETAVVCACYGSLLFVIVTIDRRYQLISPALCQLLLTLGIVAAFEQIIPLSPKQSLQSALYGFLTFFFVYHLARFYFRQEAFGRGDYWLIAGLCAFIPWQLLPLMMLIACLAALIYALILKLRRRTIGFIPFAPFLGFGGLFTFLLNNASIGVIYLY